MQVPRIMSNITFLKSQPVFKGHPFPHYVNNYPEYPGYPGCIPTETQNNPLERKGHFDIHG